MTRPRVCIDDLNFVIAEKQSPYRKHIEKTIQNKYYAVHKATLYSFPPTLLAVYSNDNIAATLGATFASTHPLFLEQYFKLPLADVISTVVGNPVKHHQLIELGNFTAFTLSGGRQLVLIIAAWLQVLNADIKYVLFTLTPPMADLLRKFQLPLHSIQSASAECLPINERKYWGKYYNTHPSIYYTNVEEAIAKLRAQSTENWAHYLNLAGHAVKYTVDNKLCITG